MNWIVVGTNGCEKFVAIEVGMHGCGSGAALIVNAEVDSMGGVVDGGVGIGIKTSPRQAAIERAQAELRQEYDVREEKRRELDFLEKGGNPLDFKFGNATSISVQSTSLTDHHTEHFVTSEVKGSFVLTASPHGDSVESSGRPGAPIVCDPNSADNFVDENEIEGERNVKHSRRTNVAPSEHSSQMDGTQIAKESEDSAIVRPYARRNRSRPNRDGARSSSTDIVQSSVGHGSFLKVNGALRNLKGPKPETNSQERTIPSFSNPKSTTSNGEMASQIAITQSNMELDGNLALDTTFSPCKVVAPEDRLNVLDTSILSENQCNRLSDIDAQQRSCDVASVECDQISGKEQLFAAASDFTPAADSAKPENGVGSAELNGVDDLKRDGYEGKNTNCNIRKGLDSESSCIQNGLRVNANNESDLCINGKTNDTKGILFKPLSKSEAMPNVVDAEMMTEKNDIKVTDENALIKEGKDTVNEKHSGCDSFLKVEGGVQKNSELNHELNCSSNFRRVEHIEHAASHADKELCTVLSGVSNSNKEIISAAEPDGCVELSMQGPCETALLEKNSAVVPGPQSFSDSQLLVADKEHEDFILEEARLVKAKRKRIAELSVGVLPLESRRKSQWDFVLEEMEWLANDFAQERLWKMTAAAQICHRVAFTSRLRVEEKKQCWKLRRVACDLANAVMQFWHSVEILMEREDQGTNLKHDLRRFGADEICKNKFGELDKEKCREFEIHNLGEHCASRLQGYAVRFLKYNNFIVPSLQAEAQSTPDRVTDWGCIGISWEDHLTEESLFYVVPSGAMEAYRISIESHLVQCEKTGISMQEEVDTSMYDSAAEFGYRENRYVDEEGETSTYYVHGAFDGNRSTKHEQKRKNLMKKNSLRSYELGVDLTYGHHAAASQQNSVIGKRPASNLHVGSIPTKRVRSSASRQRFVSPFDAGAIPTPAKTDASSGDTSSFQDDQSTLHGGSQIQKCIEVESVGNFEKQLRYDSAETTIKPKKKKEAKNLGFDQGWQLDSIIHNEQRDHSKKRLENHHFASNGTSSLLYGQHPAKKLKLMKQSLHGTLENMSPVMGSIPSPAASQMSHMPSTSKSMKTIGNKDRGNRKPKLKVIVGQPGSGCPWSLFEDQALVVLVHDMGPNWELVSDAINSTLQFKCMFRKPMECKERHKFLMDKSAGDGAESADDSGSSQSYPSTLPGIPKGSARQLFQRLQGPMEEDALKSHFEKIITIGKKYHYRRTQNDNMDPKQIVPIHNSHLAALDQVPTSPDGGALTPLDLCDTTVSSPETLPNGYPSSHATGVPMSNQSTVGSVLATSGANSSLQASPSIVLGNNSSPSGPLNTSTRDGRYSIPITSLPADDQQRLHYNKMLSNRNLKQSNLPVTGALSGADRVVRMVPGGNTVGMMPRMNKSMPLNRQGFQGMASAPLLNSTGKLSTGMVGMASPVSMQPGSSSGQGNSMMRSRDGLQMVRTGSSGNNSEHQRKMLVPELQLQVSQGTSQGVPAFSGLSSPLANQSTTPAVQGYPGHPQQSHAMCNPHHPHLQGANHSTGSPKQSYAIRLEKDRQMQQRLLQRQQQQQLAASGAPMPLVTSQPQLPMPSSSMQNSSQIQPQTSTQPVSLVPLAPSSPVTPVSAQQQLQKHTLSHHGINRNSQTVASGLTNLVGKQRPRQPQQHQQFQQAGRVHPQQRQLSHSPQQAKVLKGIGRGNMVVHQNLGTDHSHLNGLSVPPSNQSGEKGEHVMHMMQGQGLYSGTGLSSVQPSKPFTTQCPNHSQSPSKLLCASAPQSKQMQQMPSHSDTSPQGPGSSVSGHTLSAAHQTLPPANIDSNHQQMQPTSQIHQKQSGQSAVQRTLQQNRQLNSELQNKLPTDQGHLEKQPVIASKVPQMSTNAVASMSQACNDSSKKLPDASSAALQWKHLEPPCDTMMTNPASVADSVGSTPLTNLAGNEPVASANSGLGQRKLSGGMAQHVSAGTQLQQPQLSQSTPPPSQPSSQPLLEPQEQRLPEQQLPRQQLPPQQHSQQLMPLLQSAQGSLYIRPTNSQLK